MAKFCGGCGHEVPETFNFCPECGTALAQEQPQTMSFEGVANRSVIQQIGTINIGGMSQEQFAVVTEQLAELLGRLGVPTQLSSAEPAGSLSPEVRQVAQAVSAKLEEAQQKFGKPVGDPEVHLRLGNVAYESKNYQEMLHRCDQALALRPDDFSTWILRSIALEGMGRKAEARKSARKCEELRDAMIRRAYQSATWSSRGDVMRIRERWGEAVASYDKALAIKPDHAVTWHNRGIALGELGRHREAEESFKRAAQLRKKGT